MLGSVSMVQIPVHDQDAGNSEVFLGPPGSDRHIVEKAKPFGLESFRVMSRRSYQGESDSVKEVLRELADLSVTDPRDIMALANPEMIGFLLERVKSVQSAYWKSL